ncbi:MAG: CHC2 zinc finger domain-containing protein [Dehalococcoidia bacterium]|nr:CHC2 zinc finger domain-containing protein [Dehalococcoidia bacterium]
MKGLCPFHQERSPSFYVWPASQRWRCFGSCVEGGEVIDLLRKLREQGGPK